MKPMMINLGWAMARLELVEIASPPELGPQHKPQLVISWPTEDGGGGWLELYDYEGLHSLRDALGEFLDEFDSQAPGP
jgi:hypothetical protein